MIKDFPDFLQRRTRSNCITNPGHIRNKSD